MADVRRVLVRTPNWLGDAVMAIPALAAIRAAHRDARIVLAAPASIASLFREQTGAAADEVLALDRDRELEALRSARADAVILLPNSFGSAWTARRAGIPDRWGFAASGRSPLLTRAVRRPSSRVHQVDYYLALVNGLGCPTVISAPRLRAGADSVARASTLLTRNGVAEGDRLAGFAPGAAYGGAKQWPPDRVAKVAAALASRGWTPVFLGAAADRAASRAIESALPAQVRRVNLIGSTTLQELVGVVARCGVFLSNDSGAMHIAAALGVPLTAVFGPTDDRVTSPAGDGQREIVRHDVFCRPCMLRECPIDHRCMTRVTVEEVLESLGRVSGS